MQNDFLEFNSFGHGIKIEYPFDWIKSERNPNSIISLYSPLENISDTYSENLIVQLRDLPIKNMSLDKYTASNIEQIKIFAP